MLGIIYEYLTTLNKISLKEKQTSRYYIRTFKYKIIEFLDITCRLFFYLKRFGDWTPSPSSGNSLLSWAQLTELVPISGPEDGGRMQSLKFYTLK
jgi:hypothetical protein